ncbi:type II toxin-antitoxin system antitoxin SocA domain-containing protein [Arcicella sp. DC2W]|uniref:Type II toxin-antitoxin system antitoxin SocA domain-containing protein n=1 Tax=Arcicella gelida TaxID=2984195 RepID=A0ABU5S615_9BACT|nr:type II toxin-antitoxin system antitoxin SocA domain-containing protein [Arcicella sp. DC2W]MEA5403896.1 type II toxin-antitoxin system antitoxin SocA domain-containing protein [Arcicella sp. DC2W]
MKYDSITAAKYMVALAREQNKLLNATQLQKLLFIAYGFALAKSDSNESLLNESPRVWPFGPVFPKVHSQFKYFDSNIDKDSLGAIAQDVEVTTLFNKIINSYSRYSASQLSDWSHSKGSPWEITTRDNGYVWDTTISDEVIMNYFKKFDDN